MSYSNVNMETDNHLPDSGGHYYDNDPGGLTGAAKRNYAKAKGHLLSGDAGATIVASAIGFAAGTWLLGKVTGD